MQRVIVVAVNESGKRIGETHHNSTLSDATIDRIRELHEDHGRTYRGLARDFNLNLGTIIKILTYQRRAQTPVRWKRIRAVIPVTD
jgi:hypothetical protein